MHKKQTTKTQTTKHQNKTGGEPNYRILQTLLLYSYRTLHSGFLGHLGFGGFRLDR